MSPRQILGLLGSIALMLGVFLPLARVPILGSLNYFHGGKGDGVLVIVLGFIALLLTLSNRLRQLWIPGVISGAMLGYVFWRFSSTVSEMRRGMKEDLADNPFRGLGEAFVAGITLDVGFGVLLVGSILLVTASFVPEVGEESRLKSLPPRVRSLLLTPIVLPKAGPLWRQIRFPLAFVLGALVLWLAAVAALDFFEAHRRKEAARLNEQIRIREEAITARESAQRARELESETARLEEERRQWEEEMDRVQAKLEEEERLEELARTEAQAAERERRRLRAQEETARRQRLADRREEEQRRELRAQAATRLQSMRSWHERYLQSFGPVKELGLQVGNLYTEGKRDQLSEACRGLALAATKARDQLPTSEVPDEAVATALASALRAYLAAASHCQRGSMQQFVKEAEQSTSAFNRLAQALAVYGLSP